MWLKWFMLVEVKQYVCQFECIVNCVYVNWMGNGLLDLGDGY